MKILRFLGVFSVLCALGFSTLPSYAGSTSAGDATQPECADGVCQVCDDGTCTNVCDSGYWGVGGTASECTRCATNPGNGFDKSLFGTYNFNRTIGTCYKYCDTDSCTDISNPNHSAWSGYNLSGISIVPFDSAADTKTIGFYEFNSNTGGACNTGTTYCPIIMVCNGTSACKPRTNPVVFKNGDTTLGTLYVVRQNMWSSQNTNFQNDMNTASYSGVVFPIFKAPTAPEKQGYDFLGYYTAQTGGDQIIGADGQLTQSNAPLAETQGILYAQYQEKSSPCNTEIYLDANGGTMPATCTAAMPFYPETSGSTPSLPNPDCIPSKDNCEFLGYYLKTVQYYDPLLKIMQPSWENCDAETLTLTAEWECEDTYTVQCPSAANPDNMYSIDGGSLGAGDTFSIDENNMLKACYHTCPDNQTLTGWDVYLNDSTSPETTFTEYPIRFVAGFTYGDANPITLSAHCESAQVKVTYACGTHGTGTGTSNYATVGQQYDVLTAASANCTAQSGYEFNMWNASTGGTFQGGVSVNPWTIDNDVTLTADWIGTCNLITFDDNNVAGTDVNNTNPQRKRTGETDWYMADPGDVKMCGKPYASDPQVSIPTNGNAIFRGYFASNDLTNAIFGTDGYPTTYGNSWTISTSTTLKALWNCPDGYTWNDSTKSCEAGCVAVDFDDTTNGGIDAGNTPFYKIIGQTAWYSDSKCSQIVNNPSVTTPTKEHADFIGYYDAFSQPSHQMFNSNGGITDTGASWTISVASTLYAQYECYEGYHLNERNECVPCENGEYWNGTSCQRCSEGATGFPYSIAPYNWSINQCYRECSDTCQDFNVTQPSGYTNTYAISKFATGNSHQIEFYGNAQDGITTCGVVTYCPYTVSENSGLPYKVPSVPVSFYSSDNYNTAFDEYHIVGLLGGGSGNSIDVSDAFEWSQIAGLGQKLYQNNDVNGRYISTPIFYPVSLAPENEPQGVTLSGYYNPRPATGVNPTAYIGSNRALGISIAQNVLNGISGNAQTERPLYAQSGTNTYNILYVMNGGTNYDGAPTSYVYGEGATIDGVPTRDLSNFLGWCLNSDLTDCHDEIVISETQTGDVTVYASWECILPYHSNSAGTACISCETNQFWNGTDCESCPSSFPRSKPPFNWSDKTCYRECPSSTILGAAGQTCNTNYDLHGLSCDINVGFTDFTGSAGKQIEFKGNYDANLNTCDDSANTYCPRGLFGCGNMAYPFKQMTAPVNFYDATGQQNFGSRYIFGSRGGGDTIDLSLGKLWSFMAGPGQKSDVLHNNVGGVMMDYQYTHIIYPTYAAPEAADVPGSAFTGYYYPRTNGTQYVDDDYLLDDTNAQSVLGGPSGDSNTARSLYANYSNIEYSVTYDCGNGGGGTPPASVTGIHYGDSFTPATNTCSNPGHEFGGWVVSNSGDVRQPGTQFTWQYTENKVFTADWGTSIEYHINYELYGGTASNTGMPTTYTYESGATINGVPTRDNSIFDGWCTDSTLQNCAMTQTLVHETGDKTFYAKWRCESGYTLNGNLCDSNTITLVYANGGHGVAPTEPSSCTYGQVFTLPAAIVPNPADGYTFNKWTVNDGSFGASTQIACDYTNLGVYQGTVTITATWGTNPIIIDWNENGGNALPDGACMYDDDLTLTNAPTYSGYTFNGWLLADGITYANPSSIKSHGCVSTYIGVTSGTSTAITAQWCQNCVQPEHGTCTLVPQMNGECTYTTTCESGYDISGEGTPTPVCTGHKYTVTYRSNGGAPTTDQVQTVDYLAQFTTLGATTFTKTNNILTGWNTVSGGAFTGLATQYSYNIASDTILDAAWGECTCHHGTGVDTCTTSVTNNTCQATATCDAGYINPNVMCIGTACDAACSECPAGFVSVNNECQPCPAGTYQFGTQCLSCLDGYISNAGATECTPCDSGYSSNADHTACEPNTITLVYANGGHGTAPAQDTCLYNRTFALPAAIVPNPSDGYTFNKWSVNNNSFNANAAIVCNYANLGVYNGTAIVMATWGADTYIVSFDANGGTGGQTASVNATYNQAMPSISTVPPVKPGYTFMGWYDNANYLDGGQYYTANGISARTYDKTTNTTLYAGWYANTITLNFANGGHGVAPNSKTCMYGSTVNLPSAIVAEGFTFKNWAVANRTFNAGTSIVCNETNLGVASGSVTITAQWQSKTYTVTYNCGTGGGNAPTQDEATYDANFTPATNTCQYEGHIFTGWRVSDTTDVRESGVTFKWRYTENKVFTAQWDAEAYNIVYELNGGTNYTGAPQTYTFGVGARIDGTPTRTNSVFKGWCTDTQLQNCAMMHTIARNETGTKTFYAKWVCANGFIADEMNTTCDACPTAQHAENGQCVDDVIECELPDANYATRTWNQSMGAYGPCTVVTCAPDYHLVSNVCVKDTRECAITNGYGTQDWNGTQWGKCVAEVCDAGFEIVGDSCVECSNRRQNGEIVVSSYANGCEIASCMYHGQKYILNNNECELICETKSDETGSMSWNESRQKCARTCNQGYKMW